MISCSRYADLANLSPSLSGAWTTVLDILISARRCFFKEYERPLEWSNSGRARRRGRSHANGWYERREMEFYIPRYIKATKGNQKPSIMTAILPASITPARGIKSSCGSLWARRLYYFKRLAVGISRLSTRCNACRHLSQAIHWLIKTST